MDGQLAFGNSDGQLAFGNSDGQLAFGNSDGQLALADRLIVSAISVMPAQNFDNFRIRNTRIIRTTRTTWVGLAAPNRLSKAGATATHNGSSARQGEPGLRGQSDMTTDR